MFWKKHTPKINFLVAGAQKSGTTALDAYLRNHPEIGMAKIKEVHFFDNEVAFSTNRVNYRKYEARFDFSDNRKIYGETTPIYVYWTPSCRRIWEYNPAMKLIFILRNPIDRAFSHWNMEYIRKLDDQPFEYAIRNESMRTKEALPQQHEVYSYLDRGFYSEQIRRFQRYFPNEQMLFIKYESYKSNQEATLTRVFDFLEVDPNAFSFKYQEANNRKKLETLAERDKKFLLDVFEHDIRQVEKMLDWDCSDWLQ